MRDVDGVTAEGVEAWSVQSLLGFDKFKHFTQFLRFFEVKLTSGARADHAGIQLVNFVGCCGDIGLTHILHVVINEHIGTRQDLESFGDTSGRDEGVGRSDGGDDVFDYAHGEVVGHSLDAVLVGSRLRLLADPLHVLGRVFVDCLIFAEFVLPLEHIRVLDAVFW